jgi:nitroreductase
MPNARSRHGVYIDGSLATMSLIYALEARGISSCCLVFDDSSALAERARQLLALEPAETVVLLLAAGYSDNQVRATHPAKKGVKEMRRFLTAPVKPCEVP